MQKRPYFSLAVLCFLLAYSVQSAAVPVLVSTDWVAKHRQDKGIILVDMSQSDLQYARFHLPGAIRLPYRALKKRLKAKKFPVRLDNKELYRLLGLLGITRNMHIIIYDDMGGLESGRFYWELERTGHPRVSVMNGGLVKWVLEGRPVDNKAVKRPPTTYQAKGKGRRNEVVLADVLKPSGKPALLLDVRTKEEYHGDMRRRRGGHIPGAHWWEWDQSVNIPQGFVLHKDKHLLASLKAVGVTEKKQQIIVYCRSGHRAAQSYLVLRSLGFTNVRLYANSMNEYGSLRTAPLRRGMQP